MNKQFLILLGLQEEKIYPLKLETYLIIIIFKQQIVFKKNFYIKIDNNIFNFKGK